MPVTLTPAVDLDKVKLKWQEPYVSEGLNRQAIPTSPRGVYRGLRLAFDSTQGGGDRRVLCEPDPSSGVHEAVYQTTDGFSMTYRDESVGSITFDLSDSSLDNTDVLVVMIADYGIGTATTAAFVAYTQADFDALPATVRNELVVFGTVAVGGSGINIPADAITNIRRTVPWAERSPSTTNWSQLMRNGTFEEGDTASAGDYAIPFWNRLSITPAFVVETSEAEAQSGIKSMRFGSTGAAAWEGIVSQFLKAACRPGQVVRLRYAYKRGSVAVTASPFLVAVNFLDKDGVYDSSEVYQVPVDGVPDADFVEVEQQFVVPPDVRFIDSIDFQPGAGANASGAGDVVFIDDVQVWLEVEGVLVERPEDSRKEILQVAAPLVLADEFGELATDKALVSYTDALPTPSEGLVSIGRWDTDLASPAPVLQVLGRMFGLGDSLLGSVADALVPRVEGTVRDGSGVLTLISDWGPVTLVDGRLRLYADGLGSYIFTLNARWDGALWQKDVAAQSVRILVTKDSVFMNRNSGTVAFSSWAGGFEFQFNTNRILLNSAQVATLGSIPSAFLHFGYLASAPTTSNRFLWPGSMNSNALTVRYPIRMVGTYSFTRITIRAETAPAGNGMTFAIEKDGSDIAGSAVTLAAGSTSFDFTYVTPPAAAGTWDLTVRTSGLVGIIAAASRVYVQLTYEGS